MTGFAWLIEAPGQRYLAVRKAPGDYRGEFYWMAKAEDALRFFNKTQADFSATAIRKLAPDLWGFALTLGEAWPREHGWLDATDPADPQPAKRCRRPEGCVCGGDTPGVRAGCQHWRGS